MQHSMVLILGCEFGGADGFALLVVIVSVLVTCERQTERERDRKRAVRRDWLG